MSVRGLQKTNVFQTGRPEGRRRGPSGGFLSQKRGGNLRCSPTRATGFSLRFRDGPRSHPPRRPAGPRARPRRWCADRLRPRLHPRSEARPPDPLEAAGCARIFADKKSGKDAHRPELKACRAYLRPGDTLVVPALDRLARSLADLIALVGELRGEQVGFRSLHEALDTTTPGGRLIFHVFAALAEFIRELIVEGTHEGLEAARDAGKRLGRPPALTAEQVRHARDLLTRPDNSVASIARLLGVSRSTIYKNVPELSGGRAALTAGKDPGAR
ncbi:recombinase family protein [Nocardiopsis sp. N85]|nr:recombinase family protein [Nocardiopsis sp. N85]MDE3722788.1 recombinase family protein [Nocardiopsis sp. N85]